MKVHFIVHAVMMYTQCGRGGARRLKTTTDKAKVMCKRCAASIERGLMRTEQTPGW